MGRKRKTENSDVILKASYRLFMSRGYDNVSVLDIQKECGVHTRGFYRYFNSKHEILGTIIETIEKKMLDYLQPVQTGSPELSFVLFTTMKYEHALANPDYFRLRASFISRPDTFIKSFIELYGLSYPQENDWKSNETAMLQGLYVLGGLFLVQYGFIKNISGNILSEESMDFLTNYDVHTLSEQITNTYRRFMRFAVRNDLRILGLADAEIESLIEEADARIKRIDISAFREYYENELGFARMVYPA